MRKLATAVVLSGALAVGSLAAAGPAAAAPAEAPPAESTQAAAAWPVWGVYGSLASCISEGIFLTNNNVLSDFVCVPVSSFFPRGAQLLLGLTA